MIYKWITTKRLKIYMFLISIWSLLGLLMFWENRIARPINLFLLFLSISFLVSSKNWNVEMSLLAKKKAEKLFFIINIIAITSYIFSLKQV